MTTMTMPVGYEFEGHRYCPDCTARIARFVLFNWMTAKGCLSDRPDFYTLTAEQLLTLWANAEDVDRSEADSEEFPVPFDIETAQADSDRDRLMQEPQERCECGEPFTEEF